MSKRFAQVIILAEDERSANFLRRYVIRALDIDNRRIRIPPFAKGDAKRRVLDQYPVEVRILRTRHTKYGLVVHLDADVDLVFRRASQLTEALQRNGLDPRRTEERICHAIPRRHIETWLCALMGLDVNEEQDCKNERLLDFDAVLKDAALKMFDLTRPNAPPPSLPSLAAAIPELQRLEL